MEIILYKTVTESNRLTKVLTDSKTINGNLQSECSLLNPSITLGFDSSIISTHYNYAYISDFDRYYYVNTPIVNGKTITLNMSVDVLMTYANDIKNSTGRIVRSNKGSKYLNDNLTVPTSEKDLSIRKIGNGFTAKDTYIIELGGGA